MKEMKHWPSYTTPNEKPYALNHVKMLEVTLDFCKQFRTAVQAGGSIGYWPARMAEKFERVITFEPEKEMFKCLKKNLAGYENVEVRNEALDVENRKCGLERSGFGSHYILPGDDITAVRLDDLAIKDVDLIQLDIEGYECNALEGAEQTVDLYRPIIQVECNHPERSHGLWNFFETHRYKLIHTFTRDYVFAPK